ncbi:hypothetical protein [Actinomadura atramentaria]|uniref:hypothetical protein n=1 Tax=Actinomadura atramentaria TaxID=1990 RepID=UPI000364C3FE|nr:hypothetical protein [Actinomadura atramentaria]
MVNDTTVLAEDERLADLERRLRAYHGVSLDEVLEVVGYLQNPGDLVLAGGSLALGLGNRLSDFDLVVCGADTASSRVPLEHWVKTLRVDAWTRSHAAIEKLFGHAVAALDGTRPIQGSFGTTEEEQQLKLLHRIAFGIRLDGPRLDLGSVGDPREIARDLLIREYAERMHESALIAQLALRAGRVLAATSNARLAVEECLHMLLAAGGVPFTGDKWLYERLQGVAPGLVPLHDRFSVLAESGEAEYVAAAVDLCAGLSGRDLGVDALIDAVTWSATPLRGLTASGDRFLVAPEIGGMWHLDADEFAAWQGLEGRSESAWRGADCTRPETDLLVRLYERGLVEMTWDRGIPVAELTALADLAGFQDEGNPDR